jgi:hypothetical protein
MAGKRSVMSYRERRGIFPGFQPNVRMQLGRVGVPADQFEQRENKELAMVDSGDAVPPDLQTNVKLHIGRVIQLLI